LGEEMYEVEVPGQEVDQRKLEERLWKKTQARKLNREDSTDRNRWKKTLMDD